MTQAPPTWPEIEALPEFQTAPPEKKMEGLRKWKQDVLDYSGVQYDEELDNIVASKLFEFDEKPMFKSWESPFKIIGYKGASGIMGVPESFESIKFQLASQLPDQVVAGMYALEPVVQPEIGHPFSKLSETFGRAKKIFDEGSTEVAKTYGQDIRKRLTEFRDAKQNASSLAEPEGSGLAPELLGMVAESVPPLLYQLPAGASATMLGGPQAGLGVMAGLSGVQSEAMAYEEARQGYLDQGLSVEEAEKAAFAPAIASGAITAGLTYIFPAGKEAITKLGKPAKDAVVKLAKDGVLKAFGKGFADEAPEEFFDQLAQGFVAKASYDKDRSFTQIWNDAWKAGVAGGLVGGPLQAGVNAISPNELPPVTDNPVIEQINQSLQQANDQFVNQIVDEAIGDVSDEQLQTLLVDTAQTRPEAARAIQEELDRRNVQTTVELPPEQATEDLNTIPTVEGDLVADFNLQMEQPVEGGEVMAVEDLAEIILEEEPTNEQDLPTQGQVQGQPEPTGEALTTEQAEVTEAPVEGAISQDELAQGVQDLMPLLVNRAKQAGVQDPEAVAQDAVIKAIGTAKTVEEARKFVNSKAIERAINDDLRKQYAESRTVKTTIEGGKKRTQLPTKEGLDQPVGNEGSLTLQEVVPSDQPTPEQNVQEAERRQVFESNEDEFYSTLSPEDQAIWQRLNMPGKGRAPSDAQRQRLASKMRRFLVSKGHRDLFMTETKTKSPPNWTPSTTEQVVKLTQDYSLDKGLGPVLDSIARRSQTPYKRYLARILKRQTGREIGIKAKVYNKWRPYDGLFGYDKGKPSIIVNLSNIKDPDTLENVVLHEVLHGQTLDLIDIYRESPDLLTGSQRQTLDKLNGLLETVRKEIIGDDKKVKSFLKDSLSDPAYFSKNPLARNLYGLTNLEEFVSEAMSNAEFNDLLKNIQVPGEEVSVWSKVVEFIKELLRITTPNTAAEAAFENILALVDEGKRFAQAEGSNPVLAERTLKPAMSPAASPAQQRVQTQSLEASRAALSSRTQNFLNDQTYVKNFMQEERDTAIRRVGEWKMSGVPLEGMINEVLVPPLPMSGITARDQIATASLIMEEITSDLKQETNPILRDRLVDLELRLASEIANTGSSAGQTLQAMNHFRERLSGMGYVKKARNLMTDSQEQKLPNKVKKQGKQAVQNIREENAKAAKAPKVKEKVESDKVKISIESALKQGITKLKSLGKYKEALSKAGRTTKKGETPPKAKSASQEAMPLKFQYEDALSRSIAQSVVKRFSPQGEQATPLEQFYSKVSSLIKSKIPQDQQINIPEVSSIDKAAEFIQFLSKNREAVLDALVEAREQIYRESVNAGTLNPASQKMVDDLAAAIIAPDITDIDFGKIVRDEIQDMKALVEDHYGNLDQASLTLTDKILSKIPDLPFSEASRIAQEVEKAVQEEAGKTKKALLERLLPKAKGEKDARKAIPELIRLSNIGALTEEKYYNAVAEKMGLPAFTEAMGRKLTEWANRIQDMPQGRAKSREVQAFHDYVYQQAGVKWKDIIQGYWYGAIFSGLGTQAFNMVASFNRLASEQVYFALRYPKAAPYIAKSAIFGYLNAATEFGNIVKRGDYSAIRNNNPEMARSALEQITENDSSVKRLLSNAKYVQRFMSAVDLLNTTASIEARMRLRSYLQTKDGDSNLSKAEFQKQMDSLLKITDIDKKTFEAAALSEGLQKGSKAFNERVRELRDQSIDPQLLIEGVNYGLDVTGNREPNQSFMGGLARIIQEAHRKSGGYTRYIFPVTNVIANQVDDWINYTPLALPRLGLSEFEKRIKQDPIKAKRRLLLKDDASDLDVQLVRSKIIVGNALFMSLAAAILGMDDEEEEGYFDLFAEGPSDYVQEKQWRAKGGLPYSIKIGDQYYSYLASPFGMIFGMLGGLRDSQRYGNLTDRDALEKFIIMFSSGMAMPMDIPLLQTFSDIVKAFTEKNKLTAGKRTLNLISNTFSGFVNPNLLKEAESVLQPEMPEANSSWQYLLKSLPITSSIMAEKDPLTNMYGEEVKSAPPILRRFVSIEKEGPIWGAAKHILDVGEKIPVPTPTKNYYNPVTKENEPLPKELFGKYKRAFGQSIKRQMEIAVTQEGNRNPLNITDPEKMKELLDRMREKAYREAFTATNLKPPRG